MEENQNNPTKTYQQYMSPHIEIIDIEMEQNILGGSTGEAPNLPGEDW